MAESKQPTQDSPVPPQKSKLSRACPWCGHSIERLAPDGLCPKCGKAYEAWMLGPVPREVVPWRTWLAPGLFWIITITGFFVYGLVVNDLPNATFLAVVALIWMVPSLIFLYFAILVFCAARHPRGASVVACFGLVGAALGGPGIVIASIIENGYLVIDYIAIPFLVQPVATFAALVIGSVIAICIPRDHPRAFKSTLNVTPKQRRAWIAKRLASQETARAGEAPTQEQ